MTGRVTQQFDSPRCPQNYIVLYTYRIEDVLKGGTNRVHKWGTYRVHMGYISGVQIGYNWGTFGYIQGLWLFGFPEFG